MANEFHKFFLVPAQRYNRLITESQEIKLQKQAAGGGGSSGKAITIQHFNAQQVNANQLDSGSKVNIAPPPFSGDNAVGGVPEGDSAHPPSTHPPDLVPTPDAPAARGAGGALPLPPPPPPSSPPTTPFPSDASHEPGPEEEQQHRYTRQLEHRVIPQLPAPPPPPPPPSPPPIPSDTPQPEEELHGYKREVRGRVMPLSRVRREDAAPILSPLPKQKDAPLDRNYPLKNLALAMFEGERPTTAHYERRRRLGREAVKAAIASGYAAPLEAEELPKTDSPEMTDARDIVRRRKSLRLASIEAVKRKRGDDKDSESAEKRAHIEPRESDAAGASPVSEEMRTDAIASDIREIPPPFDSARVSSKFKAAAASIARSKQAFKQRALRKRKWGGRNFEEEEEEEATAPPRQRARLETERAETSAKEEEKEPSETEKISSPAPAPSPPPPPASKRKREEEEEEEETPPRQRARLETEKAAATTTTTATSDETKSEKEEERDPLLEESGGSPFHGWQSSEVPAKKKIPGIEGESEILTIGGEEFPSWDAREETEAIPKPPPKTEAEPQKVVIKRGRKRKSKREEEEEEMREPIMTRSKRRKLLEQAAIKITRK